MNIPIQSLLEGLRIEPTGVPIYVQLRDQLLGAIGAGRLAPGSQMPTMRQVAVALSVDLNTVKHAYDALERAGALRLERGRGTFVAEGAPAAVPDREKLAALAWRSIAAARALGADPAALADLIRRLADGGEAA